MPWVCDGSDVGCESAGSKNREAFEQATARAGGVGTTYLVSWRSTKTTVYKGTHKDEEMEERTKTVTTRGHM